MHPPYPQPPHAHPNYATGPQHIHPPNGVAYRPGGPPGPPFRQSTRWDPPRDRPSHLPPKPPGPVRRDNEHHNREQRRGMREGGDGDARPSGVDSGLNYG
jgi:hypothetical protein